MKITIAIDRFRNPASDQPLRPARAHLARSHHRQHLAHSHADGSERSASGYHRDGAVDPRVFERPLRLRWALAAARPSLNTKTRSVWRLA